MSIIYKVAGVTLTNRVRLLDEGGSFVTAANRGELGSGGVEIDDPGSTLTITGWQTFTVDDDEAFPDNRIFTGYIAERPVGRGSRMRVGSDRTHSCTILDLNALLHVHVLHVNAAKRAAESDVARVAYLLTSEALSSLVVDSGLVSTSGPINFLASDLRRSFADDVIGAMAPISAKNFFVYRDPTTGNASLYHDTYQAAVNSSALKISNVNADVDNVTTFAPSMDATDEIQPNEVYSGVSYGWQGAPLYVTSATTAAAFFSGINGRDAVYDTDRVGHLATAQSEAASYLNVHSTETHFLNVRVVLPSAKATQIKAGQRIQVKFSHLDGFTSFTWVRIIRCGARPGAPQFWELALELWVPQVPVSDAVVVSVAPSDTGFPTGPGSCTPMRETFTRTVAAGSWGPSELNGTNWSPVHNGAVASVNGTDGLLAPTGTSTPPTSASESVPVAMTFPIHLLTEQLIAGPDGGVLDIFLAQWDWEAGAPGLIGSILATLTYTPGGSPPFTLGMIDVLGAGGSSGAITSPIGSTDPVGQYVWLELLIEQAQVSVRVWIDGGTVPAYTVYGNYLGGSMDLPTQIEFISRCHGAGTTTANWKVTLVEFLCDDLAFGQLITDEFVGIGDGVRSTFTLQWPYVPGSVRIFVDGIDQDVTETDSSTGAIALTFVPAISEQITATYLVGS